MNVWKGLAIVCLICSTVFPNQLNAQTRQNPKKSRKLFEKAMESYKNYAYAEAKDLLFEAIQYDSTNLNSFLLLSDVCDDLNSSAELIYALEKITAIDSIHYPVAYKKLAENYMQTGNYAKALPTWKKYKLVAPEKDQELIQLNIVRCQRANDILNHMNAAQVTHLGNEVNTDANEYWPFIATDDSTLYFTRLLTDEKQYAYERLYFSQLKDSLWTTAQMLSLGTDKMVNEGTMSMTANGNLVFFTACGRPGGYGSCDIYYTRNSNGFWSGLQNAGSTINTKAWEAQPSVSSSGDRLYFASNRAGGYGGKDIWVSDITVLKNGQLHFSQPRNLGRGINGRGNDYSPFIHADDATIYFASDGKYGLGGSDLYLSRLKDSVWSRAQNMGVPVNSNKDEDGLVVSPSAKVALFSSNRKGAVAGSKDLYLLKLPAELQPQKVGYIKGMVYNNDTKEKLAVRIKLVDLEDNKEVEIESTTAKGYATTLKAGRTYAFHIAEPGYLFYSKHFNLTDPKGFSAATVLDIYLQPIKLNSAIVLNNIFFDFDSYKLKSESIPELNELIRFLKMNPAVHIEISGHTDNVGQEVYNQQLSEKRAQEIAAYLEKSISTDRIRVKGYGAEKPVDTNDTEEGRSRNRRTELRIISK